MTRLQQIYNAISPYFHDYGVAISTSLLFLVIGWWIGRQRAREQWRKRLFFNRLNVSLNIIRNETLLIKDPLILVPILLLTPHGEGRDRETI